MNKIIPVQSLNRVCGECTKCCEGYLKGEVYGHKFYDGVSCHFLGNGKCTIYTNRPENPCKNYKCYWLENLDIPEYMRPDKSNVLMTFRNNCNFEYVQVLEVGSTMDSTTLAHIIQYFLPKNINIECRVNGNYYYFGSIDFIKMASLKKSKKNEI